MGRGLAEGTAHRRAVARWGAGSGVDAFPYR